MLRCTEVLEAGLECGEHRNPVILLALVQDGMFAKCTGESVGESHLLRITESERSVSPALVDVDALL